MTINSLAEITGGDVTIDTSNGTGGSVDFNSTINSTTTNQALTINSGGGAVAIDGVIGGEASDHLDGLSINASAGAGTIALAAIGADTEAGVDGGNVAIGNNDTTLITLSGADYNVNGTLTVKATSAAGGNSGENIKFTAGALTEVKTADDNITFSNGVIHLAASTTLLVDSEGGAIDINSIMGAADSDIGVTLDADASGGDVGGETVTIGAVGSGNEIGALTITGPDGITLQGNITLSNAAGSDLDINGAVTIDGSVTIDTDNASATRGGSTVHEDGDINFSSTIDGNSGTDNLTIEAGGDGAGGALTLSGAIGGSAPLDALSINANTTSTMAFSVPQIGTGTNAGAGTSSATVTIGNANSGDITFSTTNSAGAGSIAYVFGGDTTITSGGGTNAFQIGAGDTTFKNATSTSSITFATGGFTLGDDADLKIETTNGAISVGAIAGTAGLKATDVILDAGTSTTSIGAVATDINDLTVSGTGVITLTGDITTEDSTAAGDNGATAEDGAQSLSLIHI